MAAAVASPPVTAAGSSPKIASKDGVPSSDRIPTPPTSEDMNKHEDDSSDLSDIDDIDGDLDDIKPDHYWDGENGGKIPVFKPTMSQFRDFGKFIAAIDGYGMQSGIVKVIAPQEWRDSLGPLDEAVKSIRVKNPITQEFAGTHGTYTQANIEKQRSYNLPQWKALCEESNHRTPPRKGDRRKEADAAKAARPPRSAAAATSNDGSKRKQGRARRAAVKEEDVPQDSIESDTPQVPPTPTSPNQGQDGEEVEANHASDDKSDIKARGRARKGAGRNSTPKSTVVSNGRQPRATKDVKKSVASRRLHNQSETWEVDEEAFKGFNYRLENVEQFDVERCKELEETYWKTINFGTPMYGADMPGSLFNDSVTSWNVAHLPNLLDVLGTKVPGVNTAYLYLGMWKATFAWHLEDVDLYSINYIHFGAPKQWYSISQADARKFENAMRSLWPQDYKHCDQFLRHKTYLISPDKLKSQFGIQVNRLVHYEGEFVITYPYGYHSGFNLGYNCAESVNFATEDWLNYGRIAKKCLCEADSVWVDVNEIERKLRGEPTPEYYEVTDDESDDEEEVLPTPPPSLKGAKSTAAKKRKRPAKEAKSAESRKTKRIKLRIRTAGKEPCILCPNEAAWDQLLFTDNGKQAHLTCARYTPDVYIRQDPATGKDMACNVSHIDKARLDLKCNYCRSKKGAKVQCAATKCTRSFHATCLASAGVLVDEGPVPTWDEQGVEYFEIGQDFRCRFHRPRRPKNHDGKLGESLENSKLINKFARNLEKGTLIQAQTLDSDIFAGVVVENRPSESTVVIAIEPEGLDLVEVEYKYILVLDPEQSQRPKPSPDALPLPDRKKLDRSEFSTGNRQDGVPSKGDPFMDPEAEQVWEEFNAVHRSELKNPAQKNVNMSNPEGVWYYLGKGSTDAKAQFTHDLAIQVHNPKSNFLDTVRELPQRVNYTPQRTGFGSHGVTYVPGPNGVGLAQRPPLQPRPSTDKPYQYKPKQEVQPNIFKATFTWHSSTSGPTQQFSKFASSTYTPSPVSKLSQQSSTTPPTRPHYSPPGASYLQSKPGPVVGNNASSVGGGTSLYQQAERRYSHQQSYQHFAASGPTPTLTRSPAVSISSTSAASKSVPKTKSVEYIEHISKYPYLRNAYARRPEKYCSPYANSFGFGAEYEMKLQRGLAARTYAAQAKAETAGRSTYCPNGGTQQFPQYQSSQDFQQVLSREDESARPCAGSGWTHPLEKIGPSAKPQISTKEQHEQENDSNTPPPIAASCPGFGILKAEESIPKDHDPSLQVSLAKMRKTSEPSPARPDYSPISESATPSLTADVKTPIGLGLNGIS
ncbi:uncharacterized protein PV09_09185 [Verruconis gallopava]|uniref:[histone H3]-trimethyl-L-lysine(9) demethylase n=1 Tax=Verruconis gallopava TaxID=253628 RepID=A0A0D1ZYC0_9PEZI|nr:uncharacterized protein PV09_09185 [Verruconis gallopava]KIV99079.1 hypothetical protein PV09_09185 [Verruconis gallopava]